MPSNPSEPILRLEAFPASPGQCLALRFGEPETPHTMLIDQSPLETWERQLRPYLDRLTTTATSDWRPVDAVLLTRFGTAFEGGLFELFETRGPTSRSTFHVGIPYTLSAFTRWQLI